MHLTIDELKTLADIEYGRFNIIGADHDNGRDYTVLRMCCTTYKTTVEENLKVCATVPSDQLQLMLDVTHDNLLHLRKYLDQLSFALITQPA